MPKRILIADDERDLRKLIALTLSVMGCDVVEARNGDEALAEIRANRPDLVLLDIMMPGALDGYQVLEQVRSDPENAKVKVVMLTARSMPKDIERGRSAGADDYIVKPFSPQRLIATISRMLGLEDATDEG